MNISSIDWDAEALRFAKERGFDKAAPCVKDAMILGASRIINAVANDIHEAREDLAAAHRTSPEPHGEKSGTLQVNPNGTP